MGSHVSQLRLETERWPLAIVLRAFWPNLVAQHYQSGDLKGAKAFEKVSLMSGLTVNERGHTVFLTVPAALAWLGHSADALNSMPLCSCPSRNLGFVWCAIQSSVLCKMCQHFD